MAALLAFAEPSAYWDWPCKDNDEEVGLIDTTLSTHSHSTVTVLNRFFCNEFSPGHYLVRWVRVKG